MNNEQIVPPWVKYPGFPPGDPFWRQSGEIWFVYVWEPYWNSLTATQQEEYLKTWNVPSEWWDFYFDPEFRAWLDTVDD